MKKGILYLSLAAVTALNAAEPMVPSSMSTDRSGVKAAIDAYSDGGGAVLYDAGAKAVYDNSSMNQLVFTYGDVAKESGITIANHVKSIDQTATPIQKALADKIPGSSIAINPPVNGSSCSDFNPNTSDDIFVNGVCKGTFTSGKCDDGDQKTIDDVWHSDGSCYGNNVEGQKCSDGDFATINDVWHNGVCAGTNVENLYCDDQNDQTINDVWHNGVCAGMMVEGLSCDDGFSYTTGEKWHNGVCAGGTYAATGNTTYSCSAGALSGQNCITSSTAAATSNTTYSCSAGTLSGTNCVETTTYGASASTVYTACPANASYAGVSTAYVLNTTYATTCKYKLGALAIYQTYYRPTTTSYSCQAGDSISGTICTNVLTTAATPNTTYSCPSGGTLSGQTCTTTTTTSATPHTTYSCPSGGTLSGTTCTK